MDDGDSGDSISRNVVFRCSYGPFIGGGHDNLVTNNLIVDCEHGIHLDARGASRNYNAKNQDMVKRLTDVNYKAPPWSVRYPEMVKILEVHPELPTGTIISRNVTVGCKTPLHLRATAEQLRYCTIDHNAELTDSETGIVDAQRLDFRLSADSVVYRKVVGFEPIPFEKMGLEPDAFRKSIPPRMSTTQPTRGRGFDSDVDVQRENGKR